MRTGDGGAAFPDAGPTESGYANPGMSLRDYFASKAMQGLLAYDDAPACADQANPLPQQLRYAAMMAESAYRFADAMLEARK